MSKRGLTNQYLEDLTSTFIKMNFLGVFPSDATPKCNKRRFCIIFNLSKHDEPGSHFIAIIKNKSNIIYFDSFGNKCDNNSIIKFMKSFKLPIKYNTKSIQSIVSNFCGYYCFYFLYICFLKCKPLFQFINMFPKNNCISNDKFLLSFILKSINKHLKLCVCIFIFRSAINCVTLIILISKENKIIILFKIGNFTLFYTFKEFRIGSNQII